MFTSVSKRLELLAISDKSIKSHPSCIKIFQNNIRMWNLTYFLKSCPDLKSPRRDFIAKQRIVCVKSRGNTAGQEKKMWNSVLLPKKIHKTFTTQQGNCQFTVNHAWLEFWTVEYPLNSKHDFCTASVWNPTPLDWTPDVSIISKWMWEKTKAFFQSWTIYHSVHVQACVDITIWKLGQHYSLWQRRRQWNFSWRLFWITQHKSIF